MSFKELYKEEKARAEASRAAYREEHDLKDFIKWPQGVTAFTLTKKPPRDGESWGKTGKFFRILVDGVEYDWFVNVRSPMYLQVLEAAVNEQWELSLNRLGEGTDTRYSLIVPS